MHWIVCIKKQRHMYHFSETNPWILAAMLSDVCNQYFQSKEQKTNNCWAIYIKLDKDYLCECETEYEVPCITFWHRAIAKIVKITT